MNESRIGIDTLPPKAGEHFIKKVAGATASAPGITPDRICSDAELKGYGSVSDSGKHVQPNGGGL